ncbi:MAG TPA: hypothetical protein VHP31_00155 [Caproicibacter sp.]|nr:hypothetical protein [Caproicibacter sp.]
MTNIRSGQKGILTLDGLTCIDSAEGMAKRVLNDLKKSGLSKHELVIAYSLDYLNGGYEYPNLIQLGQLLKEIVSLSESDRKE